MIKYTRQELDAIGASLSLPAAYDEDEFSILVNGMAGEYKIWASKRDRSVTPCLLGEVGGMRGGWENWVASWHTKNLDQFDTYIDVGANCGYFAGIAAARGLAVIAIEANPEYSELLRRTVEENEFDNFSVINAAVANMNGATVTLNVLDEMHGSSSIVGSLEGYSSAAIEVDTINIDALTHSVTTSVLIKMDIEGAEHLAFMGAKNFNKRFLPTYVLEYTPNSYEKDFFADLSEYGNVTMVDSNGNEFPVTKNIANSQSDWITLVVRPYKNSEDN